MLLSYFVLKNFKFLLANWSRNFKERKALKIITHFCSLSKSSRDGSIYLYVQTQNDFSWVWQSTFLAFLINPILFLISSSFKYVIITSAFTSAVPTSWISHLIFTSVSQLSTWKSIIAYSVFPKHILFHSYLPYVIWYKHNYSYT